MISRSDVPEHPERVVVVTGDVTMDWHIACARSTLGGISAGAVEKRQAAAYWQRGGAALLADLIQAISSQLEAENGVTFAVRQTAAPQEPVAPGDPRFHHLYSQWTYFPYSERAQDGQKQVWRMAEWLGLSPASVDSSHADWACVVDDTPVATLVVLDDANLGFRDHPTRWPLSLQKEQRPWILLQMSQPVAHGPLWEHLHRAHADRLIVVTAIDDLRQTEVQISRGLSWERTAQDLAWEYLYNPRINTLSHCAHVVVSFGTAGAMLLSHHALSSPGAEPVVIPSRLYLDPKVMEGMWEHLHPGGMIGATACLTAALAHQLMLAPEAPDIDQAIQSGLAAMRTLHQQGYGTAGSAVTFPIGLIVTKLMEAPAPFAVAQVQDPGRHLIQAAGTPQTNPRRGLWTILEDRYVGELNRVAEYIVRLGAEVALQGVPLGQFGALLTVDRQEIESFRSLRALIHEYTRQLHPKQPLSIAVFGEPGSGKSFGVSEVARSLRPGQMESLVFNLSQFESHHQLLNAFHQVRDTALSGRIPLVFWDEFDTALENQPLGWLRYFLAPMQDGAFREGQIVHPLGRAIFVFAGGTTASMASFDRGSGDAPFRAAKGPDFISRLKGYVNILGPNPQGGNPEADRYYIVRRAILLRFLLQSHAPQIFQRRDDIHVPQIDSGVLRAFLEIPAYRHGARSMEAVVSMSMLADKSQFERSSLPTEAQLDLHVDGRQFFGLVHQLGLNGVLLEKLAEAVYEMSRTSLPALLPPVGAPSFDYANLAEEEKEQNRQMVRDLPARLAQFGYIMRPARSDEPPFQFPDGDRQQLAEIEHERWLKVMVEAGWRYGPELDWTQKTHPALLPWVNLAAPERADRYSATENAAIGLTELPEGEKAKVRHLVDGVPQILARAGYTMIKAR